MLGFGLGWGHGCDQTDDRWGESNTTGDGSADERRAAGPAARWRPLTARAPAAISKQEHRANRQRCTRPDHTRRIRLRLRLRLSMLLTARLRTASARPVPTPPAPTSDLRAVTD